MQPAKIIHGDKWTASTNGKAMQGVLPKSWLHKSWWSRFFTWEDVTVAGREVKGFIVSPAIAGVVLAFILGVCATIYWRLSDQIQGQRDLIIELRTGLKDKAEADAEYRQETKSQLNVQKVYIDNLREKIIAMEARRKEN